VVTSPALPFAEVEVLAFEQVAVSAVVSSKEVLPAAGVEEVVPSAQVVATALVVRWGPPRKETMIPRRPGWFPGEPKKLFLRGLCRATEVVPRRGSRPDQVVARWSCCWKRSFRRSDRVLAVWEVSVGRAVQVVACARPAARQSRVETESVGSGTRARARGSGARRSRGKQIRLWLAVVPGF